MEQAHGADGSRTHIWEFSGLELQGRVGMRVAGSGWINPAVRLGALAVRLGKCCEGCRPYR